MRDESEPEAPDRLRGEALWSLGLVACVLGYLTLLAALGGSLA